jgi:uncharacterized RDD family membrane protein YckC
MKRTFATSAGRIEVLLYRDDRMISVSRFDDDGRTTAAAMDSWDYVDLMELFNRQMGVPAGETDELVGWVREQFASVPRSERVVQPAWERSSTMRPRAGLPRRFLALMLDSVIVFLPLAIVIGLMTGGGYVDRTDEAVNAGVDVTGRAFWLFVVLWLAYYVFGEGLAGATIGKGMVGIRVVDEHGEHPTLRAAIGRNLLRPVDGLFFYLVGAAFALSSPRRQRLGDRVAHTVVVRG